MFGPYSPHDIFDTEQGRPQQHLARHVNGKPWTSVPRNKFGLFSTSEYIPEGHRDTLSSAHKGSAAPTFQSGTKSVPFLGRPYTHESDPYSDKPDYGRTFHLKAGKPHAIPDSRLKHHPDPETDGKKQDHMKPFFAGKHLTGTFNGPDRHMPEPYSEAKIKNEKRPLFTWFTHSKHSMPIGVPWTTGKTTAEPLRASHFDTTSKSLPSLMHTDLVKPPSIGKEAALMSAPDPVTFCK